MYNVTFMNNTNNMLTLYRGINNGSDTILSITLLIIIWIIVFISSKHFDTKVAFLSSSTLVTFVAFIFLALNFISFAIFIFPLIMTMFSLLAFYFSKD